MSLQTAAPRPTPRTIDISATAPVPFGRLVRLEWRKMIDTRAGFWLLAITGALLVLVFAIVLLVIALNEDASITGATFIQDVMLLPVSLLVPVFAVLITTGEWSQRTHLVTFAGEPNRLRVVAAKLVAVATLALTTIVVAAVLGGLGTVAAAGIGGYDVEWNLDAGIVAWIVVVQVLYFLMGFGLGMLLLNTPGAVALYYVMGLMVPFMIYQPLMFVFEWTRNVLPWIDLNLASLAFIANVDGMNPEEAEMMGLSVGGATGTDYAQLLVATLIWVVVPLVLGTWRVRRAEVK